MFNWEDFASECESTNTHNECVRASKAYLKAHTIKYPEKAEANKFTTTLALAKYNRNVGNIALAKKLERVAEKIVQLNNTTQIGRGIESDIALLRKNPTKRVHKYELDDTQPRHWSFQHNGIEYGRMHDATEFDAELHREGLESRLRNLGKIPRTAKLKAVTSRIVARKNPVAIRTYPGLRHGTRKSANKQARYSVDKKMTAKTWREVGRTNDLLFAKQSARAMVAHNTRKGLTVIYRVYDHGA